MEQPVPAQDCDPPDTTTEQPTQKSVYRVAICDSYPLMIQSLQTIVTHIPGFQPGPATTSLLGAVQIMQGGQADILFLDGAFGVDKILQLVTFENLQHGLSDRPSVIVFSPSFSPREKACFLRAGIKGLVRKDAPLAAIQDCLRAVAAGGTWIETAASPTRDPKDLNLSDLTDRELQVIRLASQGWKYKKIGDELGISAGTVKQHMKHIFEKTGVRGRTAAILRSPFVEYGPQLQSNARSA
jgi:DNA-binding NarL/FixJ family response regulator